ncbi:MAG: hypothetical protein JNK48_06020, partial [Bryobacterales bacterium]|nr:hypothetical protein [Bryobacterales bacterium]
MLLLLFFISLFCASGQTHYPFSIDQDAVSGVADFSFLNEPLTPASR